MKKVALWNTYQDFNYDNAAFNPDKFTLSNNLNHWMILLREKMAKLGMELVTPDQYPMDAYDAFIFCDYPDGSIEPEQMNCIMNTNKPLYLILFENPWIKPSNYTSAYHTAFKKIFTWWDNLVQVNHDLYVKVNIPQINRGKILDNPKEKLASMVACNKYVHAPSELYTVRKRIIDYFSTYHLPEFDLYGVGWGEEPAYKGYIRDKISAISRYKYNFCLENFYGFNGYLTEKLFDAIYSGVVPIYYGEPNIRKILPEKSALYIDDYIGLSDLAIQMTTMTEAEYNQRIDNLDDFVSGKEIQKYSDDTFCDTLLENMVI